MNRTDIFETLKVKNLNTEFFWKKEYDNGTTLCEYKLFEPEMNKPFAFMQFGVNKNNEVLYGISVTSKDDMRTPIDCETMEEFGNVLDNLMV